MYGDKGEVPEEEYILEIGKANVARQGKDVTIVSFGKMMKIAFAAADELAKEGIDAEIIDLRSVRPIDYDTLVESVKKTNRMVVVEEAWPLASISSEIAYMVQRRAFDHLDAPVIRITCADVPLPYAPTLIEASLPNVARVVKAVKQVTYSAA
jgi:pyruvate dehydrogenase E1 component beta subunit